MKNRIICGSTLALTASLLTLSTPIASALTLYFEEVITSTHSTWYHANVAYEDTHYLSGSHNDTVIIVNRNDSLYGINDIRLTQNCWGINSSGNVYKTSGTIKRGKNISVSKAAVFKITHDPNLNCSYVVRMWQIGGPSFERSFSPDKKIIVFSGRAGTPSTYSYKWNDRNVYNSTAATNKWPPLIDSSFSDGVKVSQHCNHGGYSKTLIPGRYKVGDFGTVGIKNDDLSSIKVPTGYQVVLYEHDNFAGASLTLTNDASCLTNNNFNDRVSSMIVQRTPQATAIRARQNTDKCMHKMYGHTNNGNGIHLWDGCDNASNQNKEWIYESQTGYIRSAANSAKCLVKSGWPNDWANGKIVHLWDCNHPAQDNIRWLYEENTGYIRSRFNSAKCLHKKEGNWNNGNVIHVWDCNAGSTANKTWTIDANL